jgi:hypothetical protein
MFTTKVMNNSSFAKYYYLFLIYLWFKKGEFRG